MSDDLRFPDEELSFRSRSGSGALRLRWEPLAQRHSTSLGKAYAHPATLHIDLSQYEILSADGLVWLLALMRYRHRRNKGDTFITLPSADRAIASLVDTRFINHMLPLGARIYNEYILYSVMSSFSGKGKTDYSLHKIQPISNSTVHPVISSLHKELSPTLETLLGRKLSDQVKFESLPLFIDTLSEFLLNIVRHVPTDKADETLGYACYRPWPRSYPLLRFSCSDLGEGFRRSLERKGKETSWEGDALLEGLLYRFFNPEQQVLGLYEALDFVAQLKGKMYIRSQNAALSIDLENAPTVRIFKQGYRAPSIEWLRSIAHLWRCDVEIPGTHIAIDLRLA